MSDLPSGLPPLRPGELDAARARTVARGRTLRRRRRAGLLGGAVTAVVVLVGGVVAMAGDGDRRDVVDTAAGRPTTTTTTLGPDASCTTAVGTGALDGVPADWQDYWQTDPGPNQPLTLTICVDDATPAPGDGIRLDVTADDPDAILDSPGARGFCALGPCQGSADFGVPNGHVGGEPDGYAVPAAPVPTPYRQAGHATWYGYWVYDDPGTYTITVRWFSSDFTSTTDAAGNDLRLPTPYRSVAEATLTVTVG